MNHNERRKEPSKSGIVSRIRAAAGEWAKLSKSVISAKCLAIIAGVLISSPLAAGGSPSGQAVGWGVLNFPCVDPAMTFTNIAAGGNHSLAIQRDGIAVGWGSDQYHESSGLSGWTNIAAVAGGYTHTLILRTDGTV